MEIENIGEVLELLQVEVQEFDSDKYIDDSGSHHIDDCFICPECGDIKFWALEIEEKDICVDCANNHIKHKFEEEEEENGKL